MAVPRATMEKDLRSQEKALSEDINGLSKKVIIPFLVILCVSNMLDIGEVP